MSEVATTSQHTSTDRAVPRAMEVAKDRESGGSQMPGQLTRSKQPDMALQCQRHSSLGRHGRGRVSIWVCLVWAAQLGCIWSPSGFSGTCRSVSRSGIHGRLVWEHSSDDSGLHQLGFELASFRAIFSLNRAAGLAASRQTLDLEQLVFVFTDIAEITPTNVVEGRETAELVLPACVDALDYVVDTEDFDKAPNVLVEELSDHPAHWTTKCDWRFGRTTVASRCSTTPAKAAAYGRCLAVSVRA